MLGAKLLKNIETLSNYNITYTTPNNKNHIRHDVVM